MIKVYIIAVAIAGMLIGGFWLYQKDLVDGLQDKVTSQQEQIAGVIAERDTYKGNFIQAQNQIVTQQQEFNKAIQELAVLRSKDQVSQTKLEEYQRLLNDDKNKGRVAALLSKKTSLTISLIDKQIDCETRNFYNTDGKCIRGEYIKDGTRLVPVAPNVTQPKGDTK
jgi:hypothetical protein